MANNYLPYLPSKRLKWIGVDLDGTLAESIWPDDGIGPIIPGAKEAMDDLVKKGYKIFIYTARYWGEYEAIEQWCKDNGIQIKGIICGKPLFRWIIDDRNIEFANNWKEIANRLPQHEETI